MFKFGVASLIWTEDFVKKDLYLIQKAKSLGFDVLDINVAHPFSFPLEEVKEEVKRVGIDVVTTIGLPQEGNLIDLSPETRERGIALLKRLVDINIALGSPVMGGVTYAAWGYLTGRPRTPEEWELSVTCMREIAGYTRSRSDLIIGVEPVNRFESHFLNIAEDAVQYCEDVGTGNIKVHLDSFHMVREESSFAGAVKVCGKKHLGYVHACENNRGIPGTGLVPWKEFFTALREVGYEGPLAIESFDPRFEELNRLAAIWRNFAETGEELAVQGLQNLKRIEAEL